MKSDTRTDPERVDACARSAGLTATFYFTILLDYITRSSPIAF